MSTTGASAGGDHDGPRQRSGTASAQNYAMAQVRTPPSPCLSLPPPPRPRRHLPRPWTLPPQHTPPPKRREEGEFCHRHPGSRVCPSYAGCSGPRRRARRRDNCRRWRVRGAGSGTARLNAATSFRARAGGRAETRREREREGGGERERERERQRTSQSGGPSRGTRHTPAPSAPSAPATRCTPRVLLPSCAAPSAPALLHAHRPSPRGHAIAFGPRRHATAFDPRPGRRCPAFWPSVCTDCSGRQLRQCG